MSGSFPWSASHPFMTFQYDIARLSGATWMALGEALSSCQHLAGVPLKPGFAANLADVYLARGVQATTAIEGNTLSDKEALDIVQRGTADVSESRSYLEREVRNVLDAVREIDGALVSRLALPVTLERLQQLNAEILDGIPDKPEVVPGELRLHNVGAGTYRAIDAAFVEQAVAELVTWLERMRGAVSTASRAEDRFVTAIVTAILTHLYIAWIHPFGNGNGRTARLVEVQILSESGVVPLVATNLLSDHYNKTRNAYYRALDAAQHDVNHFVTYAIRGFLDKLREQLAGVRRENLSVHWESYVYELFNRRPTSKARTRQRLLALQLPADRWITPEEATELTPGLARLYALAGDRTPARDLNDLGKMGLAEKDKRHYRARRSVIEAFLAPTAS